MHLWSMIKDAYPNQYYEGNAAGCVFPILLFNKDSFCVSIHEILSVF